MIGGQVRGVPPKSTAPTDKVLREILGVKPGDEAASAPAPSGWREKAEALLKKMERRDIKLLPTVVENGLPPESRDKVERALTQRLVDTRRIAGKAADKPLSEKALIIRPHAGKALSLTPLRTFESLKIARTALANLRASEEIPREIKPKFRIVEFKSEPGEKPVYGLFGPRHVDLLEVAAAAVRQKKLSPKVLQGWKMM